MQQQGVGRLLESPLASINLAALGAFAALSLTPATSKVNNSRSQKVEGVRRPRPECSTLSLISQSSTWH